MIQKNNNNSNKTFSQSQQQQQKQPLKNLNSPVSSNNVDQPGIFMLEQYVILRQKYKKMTILDLKKEQQSLIKDLQQIHNMVTGIIDDQISKQIPEHKKQLNKGHIAVVNDNINVNESQQAEYQIVRSKKMQIRLQKTLQNFQYMLNSQYPIQMEQQLKQNKQLIKQVKQQVTLLNRQMSIPMQRDVEICQKLQKQVFDLQLQIQENKIKNYKKIGKLQKIQMQMKQKKKMADAHKKRIQYYQGNEQISEIQWNKQKQEKLQKLNSHKQRIFLLMQRMDKKYRIQYNRLKKSKLECAQNNDGMDSYLTELEHNIMQKNKQKLKNIQAQTHNQRSRRQRIHTEGEQRYPEYESVRRYQRMKNDQHVVQQKKKVSSIHIGRHEATIKTEKDVFPTIHQLLGKKKLLIEEDCDLDYLLYKGNS